MDVSIPLTPAPAAAARRPVVLVTGGSRGIGLALARGFAAHGGDLVLVARGAGDLEAAAAAIRAEHNVCVDTLPCDLARPGASSDVLAAIERAGGYVDILVNCAGAGVSGPFAESSAEENRAALSLNVGAATRLMQGCLPGMLERRRGGILNVASLAGLLPMPHLALYGASKSYLVALSRAVASEVAARGVTVTVLLPGPVDTDFFAHSLRARERSTGLLPALSPESIARVAVEGFRAGQRVITPGMLGALSRLGLKLLPRGSLTGLVNRALRPPTADARTACAQPPHAPAGTHPAQRGALGSLLAGNARRFVLLCIALVSLLDAFAVLRKAPDVSGDFGSYVAAAAALQEHGVFSSGFVTGATEVPAPGRSLPPGYPAFIAFVAALDPRLESALDCPAARWAECSPKSAFLSLFLVQALAALVALALIYALARALSGSAPLATGTTLLAFVMGSFNDFAGSILPYTILPALMLGLCLTLLVMHRRRSMALAVLAGLLVGALALIEVYYVALWLLAPLLLLAAERSRCTPDWRFATRAAAGLLLAASLTIGPWMARNLLLFGDVALTSGLETQHFSERVVYNDVRGQDVWACLFFWLPAIGDLSTLLFPREATAKFDVYYAGSLLQQAPRILAAAGPPQDGAFAKLILAHVIGDPGGYAVSTLLLIQRGLGVTGGIFVLWGWLALPILMRRLSAQGHLGAFMLVAGPLLGMVLVQALLTANLPWMNQALLFIYAYAIVRVTGGLELPLWVRRRLPSE